MAWMNDRSLNFVERFAINVVKCGRIPRHVAFVMDGNRRYAKLNNMGKVDGHSKGFDKLAQTLRWSLELGVKEVTMYAFSIENFKRSPEEVEALLNLAREKFQKLIEEEENLRKNGVNVRVIGNISLLPLDIQQLIAKAMLMTVDNKKLRLNVAFSYTGRDEMTEATRDVLDGLSAGLLSADELTPSLMQATLYTQDSPSPDLFIRTSGEMRLSDFLPWQCSHTLIYFTSVLWPNFTLWNYLSGILQYQRNYDYLNSFKQITALSEDHVFLQKLYAKRLEALKALVKN